MPARFQLVIDCKDPELLARFWAAALGYVLEPPPEGFATWDDWRRDIGLPDSELGIGADSIIDPGGRPPHLVPCGAGRQGGQEPPPPRRPRQRRPFGGGPERPARHPQAASGCRGKAADRSRGHAHRSPERRRPRSLRGGDEGPRGQRVRHQLTPPPAAAPRPAFPRES